MSIFYFKAVEQDYRNYLPVWFSFVERVVLAKKKKIALDNDCDDADHNEPEDDTTCVLCDISLVVEKLTSVIRKHRFIIPFLLQLLF